MHRNRRLSGAALALSMLLAGPAHADVPLSSRAEALGLSCAVVQTGDGVRYTRCDGELATFDGIGLRITLGLPLDATEPLPLISLFHGWLLGGRQEFLPPNANDAGYGPATYHSNVPWFASRGYAAAAWTTRGVAGSCGLSDLDPACVDGYLHLSERDYEVRDAQHLIGLLVDAGIADPGGLVATGGSLGGGMSWQLATSFPWDTPPPGLREIHLAAAIPVVAWTDLLSALVPNGRASDDPDQSRNLLHPFGVPKTSTIGGLLAIGRVDPGIPPEFAVNQAARFNETDATELHSHLAGQFAIVHAGEPYDANPATAALIEAYRSKSPYRAQPWFDALAAGAVEPVPIFAVSGWMDGLFPAVETLQMYRRLRAADPSYPIEMAFGGFAHKGTEGRLSDWQAINDAGNEFIEAVLSGARGGPGPAVRSFVAQCSPGDPGPFVSDLWDALASGRQVFRDATEQTTAWLGADPADVEHDPTIGPPLGDDPICKREARSEAPAAASWSWSVPPDGFTTAGLARVTVDYTLQGVDATVVAKFWDLGPDGVRALADRGVYRLSTAAGDAAQGRLDFKLWGTSWNFEPGHTVQLELSQSDGLHLRPDDLPSVLTWSNAELTLPTIAKPVVPSS